MRENEEILTNLNSGKLATIQIRTFHFTICYLTVQRDHALAQVGSHWLITRQNEVQSQTSETVVFKVELGQHFVITLSITPPVLHAHSLIYHQWQIISAIDSAIKQHT
jgi:hypothetical protein